MSKSMILGLVILAVLVVVSIQAPGTVTMSLFSLKWTMKTVYALLASAAVGMVIGSLLRK